MWKNIVERGKPQLKMWRMRIALWTTKATNTHSQYVILIAFPLQQWLHERASLIRYTYIVCLVCFNDRCQNTLLFNLRALIFRLTPFGWLLSITLNPTYSVISYGNIIFDLRHFLFTPTFSGTQLGRNRRAWRSQDSSGCQLY
jgi:hypothetical protein